MSGNSHEVAEIREELAELRELIASLQESERSLTRKLQSALASSAEEIDVASSDSECQTSVKRNRPAELLIDFGSEFKSAVGDEKKAAWDWTETLHENMMKVWGIDKFRLNQEAVCNAVLSNRDVLVIMPTGGGKSLTYQLPAVVSQGTTLVISPLVALIADQIMHLREAGVEAKMFNASTTRAEASLIMKRLLSSPTEQTGGSSKSRGKDKTQDAGVDQIKLCYVTPEKIAKSKTFVSTLQKMYESRKLARVVIDEAHCCSSMGHDFRPDYKQLSILKTLFPDVPIVALTATCPPHVMSDVLKILRLGPITNGRNASQTGTVLFTSPLNRPNLHYQVLKKPASAADTIDKIVEWIDENHPGSQGIIYTLSQKDTASVAQGLRKESNGRITTGIYHASLPDSQKQQVHSAWRNGSVQVVCATTAFGMGIDAPKVRFVIHHTLPKSLEGYYQESGRAGRDGMASDCLLFWKTTDLMRLSGMVASEIDAIPKLYSMINYAVDVQKCRTLLFAKWFNTSHSSSDGHQTPPFPKEPCGHCDNCNRNPEEVQVDDFTVEAYKICHLVRYLTEMNARVTLIQLGELVRGIGTPLPMILNNRQGGSDNAKPTASRSIARIDELIGGKLVLKKEQVEDLLLHLILRGYIEEQFVATAYTVNSYIKLGRNSRELLSRSDITNDCHPSRTQSKPKKDTVNFKILIPRLVAIKKDRRPAPAKKNSKASGGKDPAPCNSRAKGSAVHTKKKRSVSDDTDAEFSEGWGFSDDEGDQQIGAARDGKKRAKFISIDTDSD